MENPIKMDDLGVPLFSETSIETLRFFVASAVAVGIVWGQFSKAKQYTWKTSCYYIFSIASLNQIPQKNSSIYF